MTGTFIVIPCFNEAERFSEAQAASLLADDDVQLVLVNDGSTDQTLTVLQRFSGAHPGRVRLLNLEKNSGKAEAVRQGLQLAIEESAEITGYLDADFATPASEFASDARNSQRQSRYQNVVSGSLVASRSQIDRNSFRHYGGRLFATLASVVLKLSVYDTQCGAKLFRVTSVLQSAVETPFVSAWAFDVELIGRLRSEFNESQFMEVPLQQWTDVAGSKISLLDMISATLSLFVIHRALKRFSDAKSR